MTSRPLRGLIPDDDMDDAQAYTEARAHEQGVTEMTSILGRLQHSAMSLRHALVGDHGLAASARAFPGHARGTTLRRPAGNQITDAAAAARRRARGQHDAHEPRRVGEPRDRRGLARQLRGARHRVNHFLQTLKR